MRSCLLLLIDLVWSGQIQPLTGIAWKIILPDMGVLFAIFGLTPNPLLPPSRISRTLCCLLGQSRKVLPPWAPSQGCPSRQSSDSGVSVPGSTYPLRVVEILWGQKQCLIASFLCLFFPSHFITTRSSMSNAQTVVFHLCPSLESYCPEWERS